jgi:5'-3' exonuclease
MDRLALYLHYFIHHKQSNDPGWMHIKVPLS